MTSQVEELRPKVSTSSSAHVGTYVLGVVTAFALGGSVAILSGIIGAIKRSQHVVMLVGLGLLLLASAALVERYRPRISRLHRVSALGATVVAFVTVGLSSTFVYRLTGSVGSFEMAFYESMAGVTTNALTVLDDPSELDDGLKIWRAGTQWIGGLLAIMLAVGILPFLGGSRELANARGAGGVGAALATKPTVAMRRVGSIYGAVTVLVVVAFALVGMGLIDAVSYAFTSVSTGGFANHASSIAHFDSVAVEVVAMVVMLGAGSSVAIAWMLLRRRFSDTQRLFELRVFIATLVIATLWVWGLAAAGDHAVGLRRSAFTVVSMITTTGHRVGDWVSWGPGITGLILVLMTVGGMAGSVAGGLRWMRVVSLAQFMWRELQRQLHPNSVRAVKVGSARISDDSVDRMHAQLVNYMVAGTIGAVVLGLFGQSMVSAISLALGALSTTGAAVAGDTALVSASGLSGAERMALIPMMVAGRVFMYPALVLLGAIWFGAGRQLSARRANPGRLRRTVRK